jgi:multiple sugar transport system substrate-binding protein
VPTRRQLLFTAAATGLAGAGTLAGCSRGGSVELEDGDRLRMRVWSEAAAAAYEESLAAFTEDSGIEVELEVLTWDDYWTQLPLDVAAGSLPDVLWMNTAHLADTQSQDVLLDVGEIVGRDVSDWEEAATELHRHEDTLWGVPQLWDLSLLAANQDLVAAADGDASALRAEPGAPSDSLRDLAAALTADGEGRHPGDEGFDAGSRTTFGFSAHLDRTAVLGPFLAGQGGTWQDEDGVMSFATEEGVAAIQYLADLVADHLAPEAAETVEDPSRCRDLFVAGKLGLLQTGTYDLHTLVDEVDGAFEWKLHPVVEGPDGARPLVHSVAAVGVDPDDEDREKAIGKLLTWLGGAEGQRPLAENRLGIPAHRDLRSVWEESWAEAGVDVSALEVPGEPALPEQGARWGVWRGAVLLLLAVLGGGA